MPEYARVVTFEADGAAIDALIAEIESAEGPPPGVPATRLTVLADRAAGRAILSVRFASEEDRAAGGAVLEQMSPPDVGSIRRVSVDHYEVAIDRTS